MNAPVTDPTVPLGDLVDILSGFAFKSERFGDVGELPIIRIRDVKRGYSETFYSGDYDNRYLINDGDLLIGMDGEFNRERWRGGKALLNQRVCKLSPDNRHLSSEYLYHFLPNALRDIEDCTPFATVKHLSSKDIRDIHIPLPPLDEQRRIAAILDKANDLRRKRKRALELLDGLAQSIFLEMFKDIASGDFKPLIELIDHGDRINYGVVQPGDEVEDGIKLVRVSDLQNGFVEHAKLRQVSQSISNKHDRSILQGKEILISCVGSIGEIALTTKHEHGFNIARAVARVPIADDLLRAFVAEYLRSLTVQRYFAKELRTVSQPTLNIKQICETMIPIPSTLMLEHFRERSSVISKMIQSVRMHFVELDILFLSLQHRAFSGQL